MCYTGEDEASAYQEAEEAGGIRIKELEAAGGVSEAFGGGSEASTGEQNRIGSKTQAIECGLFFVDVVRDAQSGA
jgi:hypothetical protein